MYDDQLRQLLHRADNALNTTTSARGPLLSLAALEAEVVRRRSLHRKLAGGGLGAALVAVLAWAGWPGDRRGDELVSRVGTHAPADNPQTEPALDVEKLRAELAELHSESALRLRIVAGLRQAAEVERLAAELSQLQREVDVVSPVWAELAFEHEVDRAAVVDLVFADRLAADLGDLHAASSEYRRVAERFPGTPWAVAAQEALAMMNADSL